MYLKMVSSRKIVFVVIVATLCFINLSVVCGAVTRRQSPSPRRFNRSWRKNKTVSLFQGETDETLDEGHLEKAAVNIFSGCTADDCGSAINDVQQISAAKWQMPLVSLGHKGYYLGIFFKANWFRAYQFCRYHGLHLVSIESQEENQRLEEYVKSEGLMGEHFWTSGTDQAEEGNFFWMGTGRPFTFLNFNAGEPNNFKYENGEEEHCLELWNRDGKGLKWNDTPCSFETFFICESERIDG